MAEHKKVQLLTQVTLVIKQGMKPCLLTHVLHRNKSQALSTRTGFRTTVVSFKVPFTECLHTMCYARHLDTDNKKVTLLVRGANHLEEGDRGQEKLYAQELQSSVGIQRKERSPLGQGSRQGNLRGRGIH